MGQSTWLAFEIADMITTTPLSYIDRWYAYFLWGIIIYYLSIFGYNIDQAAFYKLRFQPGFEKNEQAVKLDEGASTKNELIQYLEEQKPYLNPELSMPELARQMGLTTGQLSGAINKEMRKNFNELINSYRIEEVKIRLLDPAYAHLSILGIAFESGFNSKATFNRAFKHFTHQTPSEFVKQKKK